MKCILCRGNDFKFIYEKDSKNKGYQKAFNRIMVIIQDKRLVKANPKEILDGIVCK